MCGLLHASASTEMSVSSVPVNTRQLGPWRVTVLEKPPSTAATVRQVHGGLIVRAEDASASVLADGMFLTAASGGAAVSTADCMPVVLAAPAAALILHVSRKTLIQGLLEEAFLLLSPADVTHIFVGPHICENHFVFEHRGADVRLFQNLYPQAVHHLGGVLRVSLRRALEQVLEERGIDKKLMQFDGRCTYETASLPSYRRWLAGGRTGTLHHLWTQLDRLP